MNEAADAALHALPGDKIEGRVFRRGSIRTAWENAVERAGLDGFRFHDLRHTFASHMVMRGANLVELRDILGHADLKMTMRYCHLAPEHKRAAVARLDGLTPGATCGHVGGHGWDKPSTYVAHGVESGASEGLSAREAGVAQWQSS